MSLTSLIIGIIACVCCSAFFSLTEMAYSSCNRIRMENLKEAGYKRAECVYYIIEHFEYALSSILIGNNLANIAGSSIASLLMIAIVGQDSADKYAWISTAAMTILIIIFGETLPKIMASKNANRYALKWAYVIRGLMIILFPVVWLVVNLIKIITLPLKGNIKETEATVKELASLIETAEDENVIDEDRSELIQRSIDFAETSAYEVMTPRIDVECIDIDDDPDSIIDKVTNTGHSRLPVCKGGKDHVIGVLSNNKFLRALIDSPKDKVDINDYILEPLYVYKTVKLPDVLNKLKSSKQHLAVVLDEYGGMLGVLTIEDVLEEIVGDIWDETDVIESEVVDREDGDILVDGDMNISDFLELVKIREDDFDFESDTVGGWVLEKFGEFPNPGDSFDYEGLIITVDSIKDHRVEKVIVHDTREKDNS